MRQRSLPLRTAPLLCSVVSRLHRTKNLAVTVTMALACGLLLSCAAAGPGNGQSPAIEANLADHVANGQFRSSCPIADRCGTAVLRHGSACLLMGSSPNDVKMARRSNDATVKPSASKYLGGKCYTISWNSDIIAAATVKNYMYYFVPLGKFVVDKIGDPQDQGLGMKAWPFKAHFEPTSLGRKLIAQGVGIAPRDINDGQAQLRQDADGKWIALVPQPAYYP